MKSSQVLDKLAIFLVEIHEHSLFFEIVSNLNSLTQFTTCIQPQLQFFFIYNFIIYMFNVYLKKCVIHSKT